jgi:taurine dioxygenase
MAAGIFVEYETMTVTRLSPHIGAEIGGVDLTQTLSPAQIAELHRALLQHGVIFFRDQPIDFSAHRALALCFGDLHIHVGGDGTASQKVPGHPEIRRQHFDAGSRRVSGEVWHTDQSCAAVPPMGSILHQHVVPPKGGDTLFTSTCAAYDALSPRMQGFLTGLTATHDGAKIFDRSDTVRYPVASHPVIACHPGTGRRLIYVNRGQTTCINELSPRESEAVLAFLFDLIEQPEWQVRFQWREHSIAFWDNRCTQHKAIWDYWPNVRSGYRIQIKGTQPPVPA